MKRFVSIGLLILFATPVFACVCNDLGKLSKQALERYDVIFLGKVEALNDDDGEQSVHFLVQELYKGSTYQDLKLVHFPNSDCSLSFQPGEIWLIYGRWKEYDITKRNGIATSDFCTFSRIQPAHDSLDVKLVDRGSYTEELKFLRDSLGIQEFQDPTEIADKLHRNELPGPGTAIAYLVAGLGGLGLVFYFVRRMFKRDGK